MTHILKFPQPDDEKLEGSGIHCEVCSTEIPKDRIDALPNTKRCVYCSNERAKVGFMSPTSSKGVAPDITIVDGNDREKIHNARRQFE